MSRTIDRLSKPLMDVRRRALAARPAWWSLGGSRLQLVKWVLSPISRYLPRRR